MNTLTSTSLTLRMKPLKPSGMALLMVLWAIAVMGIMVMGLVQITQAGLRDINDMERYDRALWLAESGMAIALQPTVKSGDPILRKKWNAEESFQVIITGEEGRLGVNAFLAEEYRSIWRNLLQQWGLTASESDIVFDCLMDWVHPGPGRRLNGADASDYARAGLPYTPTGKPFATLNEMERVLNFNLLTANKPDWRDYFTLRSQRAIDINAASADIITAITGVPLSRAQSLVDYRKGPDRIAGTEDDQLFEDLQAVRVFLGLNEDKFSSISTLLKLNSRTVRIRSEGKAYDKTVTLTAVARRGNRPTIYEWNHQ